MPKIALKRIYKFDDKNLETINQHIKDVVRVLNSQVEFGDIGAPENVYCVMVSADFGSAGVELTASHTLGRQAKGVIVVRKDGAGDVYFSAPATTADASGNAKVFLKATTSSLSAVMMII